MKYKYTDSPYKDIPKELLDEYTMGGITRTIRVNDRIR
jgi:hypothetical protein